MLNRIFIWIINLKILQEFIIDLRIDQYSKKSVEIELKIYEDVIYDKGRIQINRGGDRLINAVQQRGLTFGELEWDLYFTSYTKMNFR